jgi:NIMA (never in mitosis gene a)-related kinase
MATLHPPFMADNMEGLYKKVLKGIYPKVSQKYSKGLRNLIRMMLQVDP